MLPLSLNLSQPSFISSLQYQYSLGSVCVCVCACSNGNFKTPVFEDISFVSLNSDVWRVGAMLNTVSYVVLILNKHVSVNAAMSWIALSIHLKLQIGVKSF